MPGAVSTAALYDEGRCREECGYDLCAWSGARRITAEFRGGRFAPLPSTAVDARHLSVPRSIMKRLAPDAGHGTRRMDMSASLAPSLRSGAHVGCHVATLSTLCAIICCNNLTELRVCTR